FKQKSGIPVYSGTVLTAGVEKPVTIYYDDYGVPHIYAECEWDVAFAQGYAQANDRLFQMDLFRRVISGTLAEIVGNKKEGTVEQDIFNRTVGFRRAAEANMGVISDTTRLMLEGFAAGVNAYIQENIDNLPPEFILFGYVPEEWTPVDSLTIGKMIAWSLGGNMETELFLYALGAKIGVDNEKFKDILPEYVDCGPTIVPHATDKDVAGAAKLMELSCQSGFGEAISGIGSNNWVVSGELTESGGAMLASDMHLTLDLPAIWYMNHLVIPDEMNVTGVIFPGVPGVIAGYNEHIAWAETNLGPDVMDLYEIKFHEDDPYKYLFDGEWIDAEVINDTVKVRGGEDIELEIIVTRHGPVISDTVEMDTPLSLRWTGLDGTPKADALLGMTRAKNFEEFRAATRSFWVPAQNFVYADTEGNIGYLGNGKFPIRSARHEEEGNGLLPVPGWSSEYEWTGFVDMDDIPSLYNPPSGIIVTANHRVVEDDYPYFISYEWVHPSRALGITKQLEKRGDKLTLDDMKAIQTSFYNDMGGKLAKEIIATLKEAESKLDEKELQALEMLKLWAEDPLDEADSVGAAIFWRFYSLFIKNVYLDQLPPGLENRMYSYSSIINTIDRNIMTGQSAWINGDFDRLIQAVFTETVKDLSANIGPEVSSWTWGKLHLHTFNHYIGVDVNPKKYDRGPFKVGGNIASPCALGSIPTPETPFDVMLGAPYRYVIDMADHKAYDVLAIGNSGHFRSPHYDDMLDMWLNLDYKRMLFEKEEVADQAKRVVTLQPE
ncbi:MAG: penicillin acylase family protein, partial [Dethiobacteria bacterium]